MPYPPRPTKRPVLPVLGKLYTPEELAEALDVDVTWVWRKCRGDKPELTHLRLGKKIRFREADIAHLIQTTIREADSDDLVPAGRS